MQIRCALYGGVVCVWSIKQQNIQYYTRGRVVALVAARGRPTDRWLTYGASETHGEPEAHGVGGVHKRGSVGEHVGVLVPSCKVP